MEDHDYGTILGNDHRSPLEVTMESSSSESNSIDDDTNCEGTANATLVHESTSTRIYKLDDAENNFGGRTGAVAIKFLKEPHPPAERIRALHNEYILSRRRPRQTLADGKSITVAGDFGNNGHSNCGGGGAGAEACVAMRAALKYDRHRQSGRHAVYLEWVDGVTLREWIASKSTHERDDLVGHQTKGFVSVPFADEVRGRVMNGRPRCRPVLMTLVRLASEIAGALSALHDVAGIAHLSLDLDNVIVSEVPAEGGCDGKCRLSCCRGGDDEDYVDEDRPRQLIETSFAVKLIDLGSAVVLNSKQEPVTSATSTAVDLVSLGAVLSELFLLAGPHEYRQPRATDTDSSESGIERARETSWREGLPPSISNLLARLAMVGGGMEDATDNDKVNSCPPDYRSARDVHVDLRQMLDCPERFLASATDTSGGVLHHPLPTSGGRLYGRDEQLSRIIEVHARATRGGWNDRPGGSRGRTHSPAEVVLISGTSGSGKSSLVGSVRRSLSKGNSRRRLQGEHFFLSGKFDQLRRMEPFSTVLAAISEYSERIGGCGERSQMNDGGFWSKLGSAIFDAVGTDGCSILMDLIPEMRKILDPSRQDGNDPEIDPTAPNPVPAQSSPPLTDIQESQDRVKFILQIFLSTLASCVASEGGEPMVFFFDDLQWASEASIDLLRGILLTDGASNAKAGPRTAYSSLIFIGCHRDIDVDKADPPLLGLIRDLEVGHECAVLTKIRLGGISEGAMNNLVADTLCMPRSLTRPLADAVHRKTNGNALFAVQFLASLIEDPSFHEWSADIDRMGAKIRAIDDTSGKFIASKLGMLPPELQVALQMAACLGSHCEEDILCLLADGDGTNCSCGEQSCRDEDDGRGVGVCSQPERCFTHLLGQAVRLDLMTKKGLRYEFAHDQIQHAAYTSIPEEERMALHLIMGKRLWRRSPSPSSQLGEKLMFAAVDQILLGITFVDHVDKIPLAELFLRAGKKALSSSLFSAASMYLKAGISLLGPGHWDDHYDLSLRLYVAYAESAICNGQFDSIQFVLGDVLAHARCFEDKLRPYFIQVNGLGIMNMVQEAIGVCLHVLEHLGECIPEPENLAIQIKSEYASTKNMLEGFTDETLVTMNPMKNNEKIAAMEFLFSMVMYTYITRPSFCPLVALRMVKLSLLYGVCRTSAYAFAWYGALSCASFGRYARGYRFGQIALQLLRRFGSNELIARVYAIVYGFTMHWTEPIVQCLEPLLEGQRIGMMFGDVKYAMGNTHQYSICAFHAGRQLVRLEEELAVFCNIMKKYKLKNILAVATVTRQTVQKLMSSSDCSVYSVRENIGQEQMAEEILAGMNAYAGCHLHLNWMFLAYHFEDFMLAAEIADKTRNVSKLDFSMWVCIHAFYDSLASLALAQRTKEDKWKILAKDGMERIQNWAINSSHNFQNKAALLEAEFASLEGKNINARTLYDEAIEIAGKNGFVHEQALACERAGTFYFDNGNMSTASEYFDKAHDLYMEWGAMGKAERIRAKSLALVIDNS